MIIMVKHMQINTVGIDYYLQRSMAVTVFDVAAAVTCAVCVFFSVRMGRKARRKLEFDTSGVIFTSALVGFMLLSMGALSLLPLFFDNRCDFRLGNGSNRTGGLGGHSLLLLFLQACRTCFDPLCAARADSRAADRAPRLIVDYSAQKDYPTSAISVYHILSLVALSLFFLNEGKFAVGKGSPAAYMLFGSLSVVLLLVHALPSILLSAFWVLPMNDMDLFSAVDIACAAYILVRMASLRPADAESTQ